jgi:hypothetical protein
MRLHAPAVLRTLALAAMAAAAAAPQGCKPAAPPPLAPQAKGSAYLQSLPIQCVEGVIKFGAVKPCGDPVVRTVRIRNASDAMQEILAYASNCGCLSAKLLGERAIGPGEERDLELTVNPGGIGDRSVRVEFATKAGFAGAVRAEFSQNEGVIAVPTLGEMSEGDKAQVFELQVISNDGVPIRVIGIDPPVGTVDAPDAAPSKSVAVSISSVEALAFAGTEPGRSHPGMTELPDGSLRCLRVTITTDHPGCPVAHFDLSIRR